MHSEKFMLIDDVHDGYIVILQVCFILQVCIILQVCFRLQIHTE